MKITSDKKFLIWTALSLLLVCLGSMIIRRRSKRSVRAIITTAPVLIWALHMFSAGMAAVGGGTQAVCL